MAGEEPIPQDALLAMLQTMQNEMRTMVQTVGDLRQDFGDRLGRLEHLPPPPPEPNPRGPRANQLPLDLEREEVDFTESDNESQDPLARPQRRIDPLRRHHPREVLPRETNHEIKLIPPSFAGKTDPETYLDWERRLEYIFECYGYGEHKKVALAAAQLTGNALAWWDRTVAERRRHRFGPVTTWADMKHLMRLRYVPEHFHRDLQKRFRKLTQGQRSVEDYFEEFEKLMNSLELEESEESMMAQFIDGLQERIQRKVERTRYSSLTELLHLAVQIEQQIKRKTSLSTNRPRNTPQTWKNEPPRNQDKGKAVEIDSRFKSKTNEPQRNFREEQGKSSNQVSRTRDITCFKCQGRGHMARECLNRRVMILTNTGEYESQDAADDEPENHGDDIEYPDTGESLMIR